MPDLLDSRVLANAVAYSDEILTQIQRCLDMADLHRLLGQLTRHLGFDHFALISHADLRTPAPGLISILSYPSAVCDRIIGRAEYRRDPVMRACVFADSAFVWSSLNQIITLDQKDRKLLEAGAGHGLQEGITVPCSKLRHSFGSCTFAGAISTERAERMRGIVQIIGIFAFQRARELAGLTLPRPGRARPNPRPRDCIVLVGRGHTNKEVARALGLHPRTVAGYLADAMRFLGAADRTEMVVAAILDGEVGLAELR